MTELHHTIFDSAPIVDGEWAGWVLLHGTPFEDLAGPFYFQDREGIGPVCAVRLEEKQTNPSGSAHGGFLTTLADLAMFAIARKALDYLPAVTVSLTTEFIGSSHVGQILYASGEVVRSGGSLIFVRGMIVAGETAAVAFNGILKRFTPGSRRG